jgi:dipeptidyl aminopeptidase/acylaminoacyl peptidase
MKGITMLKYVFFALTLLGFSATCKAQDLIIDPQDCFRGPFSSYENWLGVLSKHKPGFNVEKFEARFPQALYEERKSQLECVDFKYTVDQLTVAGYYLKPKTAGEQKLPVVIFNRGGNARFGSVVFAKKMNFIGELASNGFLVIGSQYRGTSSRFIKNNGNDEFGGADVNDVLALLPILAQIPNADMDRIGMVGWSRGAMQSYLVAKKTDKVKTIVAIAGNADAEKALAWRPEMENVYKARVPNFADNREAALHKRSVIKWADALPPAAPILLIHGTLDKRVNVEQSKILSARLTELNHSHKLVIYEGDNHGLEKNRGAMLDEVLEWLNAKL